MSNKNNNIGKTPDALNTLNNAEENQNKPNYSELIERNKIQGTPFNVITDRTGKEEKHFIVWGKYRITEPKKTQEEALNLLIEEQYNIIPTMFAIMILADKELIQAGITEPPFIETSEQGIE